MLQDLIYVVYLLRDGRYNRDMEFLRHQTRLAGALVILLVAQLFVPQFLGSGAMARGSVVRGSIESESVEWRAGGIIICTSTGLMELTRIGELVPAGSGDKYPLRQTECFVCLISGFIDDADLSILPSNFVPRIGDAGKACKPDGQNVLADAVNRSTSARAPPA